jgi:hypothetical protein
MESFEWAHRSFQICQDQDQDLGLVFPSKESLKFLWTHEHQTLFAAVLDSSRDISRVITDTEIPNSRSFLTDALGNRSQGLRAKEGKVIHDFSISENGRFVAISYANTDGGAVNSTLEVFQCTDVESFTFEHLR